MANLQDRAFDRMYQKLAPERKREVSQEEYVRYNSNGFDKLEAAGGYLEDFRIDDSETREGALEAQLSVTARAVFPGRDGPSEHRRRMVFRLIREGDEWRFDSFRSYEQP